MAFHYITPGRCHLPSLLLAFLLCLGAYRIVAQPPSVVRNVQITNKMENSFTVSWNAPLDGNVTNYKVIIMNGTSPINDITNLTTYTANGLLPGITYNITIFANNDNGTSDPVTENATTLPSPVTGLVVSSVSNDSVTLGWRHSSDTNGISYKYTVFGGESNRTDVMLNTTVMQNLKAGMDYNFTVFAVTANGIYSKPSDPVNATTRPNIVQGVTTMTVSETTVTLQWNLSLDPNHDTYTYTVDIGGKNVSKISYLRSNSVVVNNLSPGEDYTFTVFAVTNNGIYSQPSKTVNATTRPSIVEGVTVVIVSETMVTLQWNVSQDNNHATYTYTVEGGGNNSIKISNITRNSVIVQDLKPGEDYTFKVFAVTNNGIYSQPSRIVNATTRPSIVEGETVVNVSETTVTLQWNVSQDNNHATYTYTVEGGGNNSIKISNITRNSVIVQDLKPGEDYTFKVFAVTNNGIYSQPSRIVNATTRPSIVQGVTVVNVSATTVTLHWNVSQDSNHATYTYTVDGDGQNFSKISNIINNSVDVQNLLPGEDYNFKVFAVTKNGIYSQSSTAVNATTKPSIVQGVVVLKVSETTVALQWDFSHDNNSKTYTYTLDGEGRNFSKISNIVTNSVTVQKLLPGEDYIFKVFAVTKNGIYSQPSFIVNATTRPSTVPTFQVSGKSNQSVSLKWAFPTDFNVATYTYYVVVDNQTQPGTRSNSTEVKNLSAGQTYNFTIYTVTQNGIWSLMYQSISVTTVPNAPRNLQGLAVDVSEININWTTPDDVNVKSYNYIVTWADTIAPQDVTSNTTKDAFFNIKNLISGHLYNITVTSVIKDTPSDDARIYIATKTLSTGNVTAGMVDNTSIALTWTIPDNADGTVRGYRVTVYLNGLKATEAETTEKKYVVNNLTPGNVYSISVESYTRYPMPGTANRMSRMDNSITSYSTPTIIKVETVPNPVKDLKCFKVDAYQIRVEYECPTGNYSAFDVLVNNGPRNNKNGCPGIVIVSNLQPAASYSISVMTIATNKSSTTGIIICYTDNTGVIVGSVFGILLFILLIALIVFFVMRKRRLKDPNENIPTTHTRTRRFHTIPKDKFRQHYEHNHADSDFGFAEEYQEISSVGTTQSKRAAELLDNKAKNRFTNVLPYDHSRVKLSIVNGIPTSDYINANYMPGYNSTKEFIACQGPLPNTTADFWRMVWEHHVNTIVMLTNCMENGRVKCEHYWPLDYTPCTYGDLTVTVTSETILSEWTIRDFAVKHAFQPGVKYVRHFHFTAWPDHGVPDSTSSIIQFRNLVREHMDQRKSNGPTIVHCSAGVGRTGTLIALDYLIQQIEKEQRIGIYGFVEKMRMNRNLMVQTEAQYVFLNKCMLDLIDQPADEHIYENHTGTELVYENVSAIRNLQRENA
ncbi:receptor-type tyrosine-protein phosphatase H [Dendropsophus ebraccatus]|uniref:receptor-type tyrosine-protein phosphatase H n=1 Tax=Dendropsophus ebraccatus TaxID=150705 RepID=UPI003831EB37